MKNNNKKTSKEKRVLIGALCVAAVMVAGSTFAWFTSKDEVTNRLSANAAYDVSIAEDFQPPEDWIPGQTINKDVSAVNTGNVDAFVRMWLGGSMRILNEDATPSVDATSTSLELTASNAVNDADKIKLGLTYQKTDTSTGAITYYKTLSTDKIDNPKDLAHAQAADEESNQKATFSEVQSIQAGGVLVYAPTGAKYHWTLEQATELPVYTATSGTTPADTVMENLPKGTVVGNSISDATGVTKKLAPFSASDSNYYGAIDASTFTPETTGLYLFRRNVGETADGTANTYEYSGYYYDATLQKYFALHTDTGANAHSDYVLPAGVINDNSTATPSSDQVLPVTIADAKKVYLYTASETVLQTSDLSWTYDATSGKEKFTVTNNDTTKPISIEIALANIGATSETWTAITDSANPYKTTFYYNNDVEAGDTTTKLVDSVKLADTTTNDAYLAFDFDLNVYLESIQVTKDETGKELTTPVTPWSASTGGVNTGATTSGTTYDPTDGSEIGKAGWTAIS